MLMASTGWPRECVRGGAPRVDPAGAIVGPAGTPWALAEGTDTSEDSAQQRIREIVDLGLIAPVFQPILDLRTNTTIAVEALSRFPGHRTGTAGRVFTDATRLGLIADLELTAIEGALAAARGLPDRVCLAINVSPVTLLTRRMVNVIADSGWPLHRLILEITEQVPITDYQPVRAAADALRGRGCRLAVDDAGAGYASFKHILALSPDLIKLDRFLITGLDSDPARQALVGALVHFATATDAHIVAEGIETSEQAQAVQELGIRYGQGYLLGRPASATALALRTGETGPRAAHPRLPPAPRDST